MQKGHFVANLAKKIKGDAIAGNRPDYYISNSDYVGQRIRKTYRREATTIHPNIDISNFEMCGEKHEYYLASSRLVSYKKIDIIIEAFNRMPIKTCGNWRWPKLGGLP